MQDTPEHIPVRVGGVEALGQRGPFRKFQGDPYSQRMLDGRVCPAQPVVVGGAQGGKAREVGSQAASTAGARVRWSVCALHPAPLLLLEG